MKTATLETTGNAEQVTRKKIPLRARRLAAEAIGIDSHIDTVQRLLVMGEDLGKRWDVGHVDIPRLREGGTHAPFRTVGSRLFPGAEAVHRTLDLAGCDAIDAGRTSRRNELATTAADIRRIVKAQKIAVFLTIEGGHTIDDDLRVLRMYYQLGMRSMTLTHSRNNNWAGFGDGQAGSQRANRLAKKWCRR